MLGELHMSLRFIKKGVSSSVENYSPISLTSVICKLFERIVKEQMLDYLRKYNLITRHQHGFLSQHSTTTELTLNDWTLAVSVAQQTRC